MTSDTRPPLAGALYWLMCVALTPGLLALQGCRQDQGISAAAQRNATSVAGEREQALLNPLKNTFGEATGTTPSSPAQQSQPQPVVADNTVPPARAVPDIPELSWSPPSTREDGSHLYPGEIQGYRLYYRLRYRTTFQVISLNGADKTHFTLDQFSPGAYEFSVTTIDNEGLESRRSSVVSVDVI